MGSQMFFAGSDDICGLNGDNGTIGVGDESSNGIRGSGSISIGSGNNGGNGSNTMSGEVSVFSGKDLRGLGGGNGTTGVGDELDSRGSSHASEENQKLHVWIEGCASVQTELTSPC